MKTSKKYIGGFVALSLALGCVIAPVTPLQAATSAQKKEAKAAYEKMLKENKSIKGFLVRDVYGDSIPECITSELGSINVYTYDPKMESTSYVAVASKETGTLYYHPEKKYVVIKEVDKRNDVDESFLEEAYVYGNWEVWEQIDVVKNPADTVTTTYERKGAKQTSQIMNYKGKVRKTGKTFDCYCIPYEKKISKATYDSKLKSMLDGTKKITKFNKNTATNRKKYLK